MPMKNPPHPGGGLRYDLEALGLSVANAAKGLGVSRQQLNNVITGRSAISPEMAVRLEKGIGGSARHWLAMQASYDLAQVRLREGDLKVELSAPKVAAE
jgi:addiction module HigA family antidote